MCITVKTILFFVKQMSSFSESNLDFFLKEKCKYYYLVLILPIRCLKAQEGGTAYIVNPRTKANLVYNYTLVNGYANSE